MQKYLKWSKNINSIAFTKTTGKCPICSSNNTDYATRITDEKTSHGYVVVWCNDCKSNIHLTDMTVEKDSSINKDIPTDIDYE